MVFPQGMHSPLLRDALLMIASAAAGAVNAVAGGGTLITFPVLIGLGQAAVTANATSTVGLVPGSLSGAWAFRREVSESSRWLPWLLPPSLLGGLIGAVLLVRTPPALFEKLAPLLVLLATMLFMAQEAFRRRSVGITTEGKPHPWLVAGGQLFIGIYGGYFGGAMGIVMLAGLGFLRLGNIHRMNGLKTFATACINGVAALVFSLLGMVDWPQAIIMAAGSTLGGYFAADWARKLGQETIRRAVIVVGLAATVALAVKRL